MLYPSYSSQDIKRKGVGLYTTKVSTLKYGNHNRVPINFYLDDGVSTINVLFELVTTTTMGDNGKYVNFIYSSRKTGKVVIAYYDE